jgi:AcrR family transcriptional regulator
VDSAAELVHEQGFGRTSLADIARASGVPLGNLYYLQPGMPSVTP